MRKKKSLGIGPIVGIVVTVIAWLLVTVFYTMKYVKKDTLEPLYNPQGEGIPMGESRIFEIPDTYGYVNSKLNSICGLFQVYKNVSKIPLGEPIIVNDSEEIELKSKNYTCKSMFLLTNSSISISVETESDKVVYGQIMNYVEYKRLLKGADYDVIDEWEYNGSYILDKDPMQCVFCLVNNNTYDVKVKYERSISYARYDSTKAYKICNDVTCVYKKLHPGYNVVITNQADSEFTLKYEVIIGYDSFYRDAIMAILWVIPVIVIFVAAGIYFVSNFCHKKEESLIEKIYDPLMDDTVSDNSFNYSRNNVNSAGEDGTEYLLFCSDEDI